MKRKLEYAAFLTVVSYVNMTTNLLVVIVVFVL